MMVMNEATVMHDTETMERMVSFPKCRWSESWRKFGDRPSQQLIGNAGREGQTRQRRTNTETTQIMMVQTILQVALSEMLDNAISPANA